MRHLRAISLLLLFLPWGTGGAAYLHELEHQQRDARASHCPADHGNEREDCPVHAQLASPIVTVIAPRAPLFDTVSNPAPLDAPIALPRRTLERLDCRGPPVHA